MILNIFKQLIRLPFLLFIFTYSFSVSAQRSYELSNLSQNNIAISYQNNPYIDHIPVFAQLFSTTEIVSILEFGLGEQTRYFLDNVSDVTSVELLTPSQNKDRLEKYLNDLKEDLHWHPIVKILSPKMEIADQLAVQQKKDPSLYDGSYLLEYKELCDSLFTEKSYDIVFVDPGIHPRGDLVNELFGRVPIIVAHDTGYSMHEYGWYRICTPCDYVRIDYNQGCGTTLWIHKSRKDIIEKLVQNYSEHEPKKFRIFFPDMHGDVTKSMRLVCEHLGHTLVLPGKSFRPSNSSPGLKIGCENFSVDRDNLPEYLDENVEVIENDEILQNPPDIFFINCLEVENDMLNIFEAIKNKDIKLAHYSGNNNTSYSPGVVRNLIAADATTAYQYDLKEIHYAFWIPWIDWSSLEYTGSNQEGTIDSYLGLYYNDRAFIPAKEIYASHTFQYEQELGFPIFTLHDFIHYPIMLDFMEKSIGTLHVKNLEGFGYTIIQSLAKGRPVFLKRSFAQGKKLMNWCIDGKTALFFDDYDEFRVVLNRYLSDKKFCIDLQNSTAKQIRCLIQNEREALIFENFIQNLK